ncbi:ATP-dependent helicase [Stratiformator vulcanicus]|nr:UvrD-helicase domain-containing protein [Stratiformator vulcanicus]
MSRVDVILSGLNAAQADAVQYLDGPLLVLAGAGTGKTRVITSRMAEMVRRGTSPERILSVTFTNKAAKEMRERAVALMGRSKSKPLVSTFHAYCVRVLREEIERLGYPKTFAIYDRGDQETAARAALREVRLTDKAMKPADLLSRISRWKMNGVSPDEATENTEDDLDLLSAIAYRRYQGILKTSGGVDFDDLLLLTVRLMETDPEVRARQQTRFDFVQIDEYQDTNGVQFRLVQSLVEHHQQLCVVGDDDQSIYGWRGAEVTHILNFGRHFPSAKVIRLEDNYRCKIDILDLANELVRHNRDRHPKKLRAGRSGSADVKFLEFDDETEEARQLAFELDYLINQTGVPPSDIAVLFRTNEQPRVIESEFRRKRLPYLLLGGQSFFDRKEIRDLLGYLRVVINPQDRQALARIINTPARGIGRTTVEKVVDAAVKTKVDFWSAAEQLAVQGVLGPKPINAIRGLRSLVKKYRDRFQAQPARLHDAMSELIDEIEYRAEIERLYSEPTQQLGRAAALDQLLETMREYAAAAKRPSLGGFLEETSLDGRDFATEEKSGRDANSIRLMTLHSAKGLEFPRVYLVGMEEGLLPHRRSLDIGGAAIEEERRLAYVGITRAMNSLTLSRALARRKWGKLRPTIPSRFLAEMRSELAIEGNPDAGAKELAS